MAKISKTTALIFAATLVVSVASTDFTGCVSLTSDGQCEECFRRDLLDNGSCGPLKPATDTCEFYTNAGRGQNFNLCLQCKPGYAVKVNERAAYTCIKGVIKDCLFEEEVYGQKYRTCLACDEGKTSILDRLTNAPVCRKLAKPLANCLWGGVFRQGPYDGASCYRCNPGFAVDVTSGGCTKAVKTGCWIQHKGGKCLSCDPYAGYSVNAQGNCVKNA